MHKNKTPVQMFNFIHCIHVYVALGNHYGSMTYWEVIDTRLKQSQSRN